MPRDRDSGIQAIEQNDQLTRDVLILRQSSQKFAAQIVAGRVANGDFAGPNDEKRERIREELEYWTVAFKKAVQTGSWIHDDEGDSR